MYLSIYIGIPCFEIDFNWSEIVKKQQVIKIWIVKQIPGRDTWGIFDGISSWTPEP